MSLIDGHYLYIQLHARSRTSEAVSSKDMCGISLLDLRSLAWRSVWIHNNLRELSGSNSLFEHNIRFLNDLSLESGSLKIVQMKKSAQVLPQKNPALPFQFASVGLTM